jgi:hypothetical protein
MCFSVKEGISILHGSISQQVHMRRDINGDIVSRGRLQLLGQFPGKPVDENIQQQVSLEEFKLKLQCSLHEPNVDSSGGIQLMRLLPPTRESLEIIAAWTESADGDKRCTPWAECHEYVKQYKEGKYPSDLEQLTLTSRGGQFQIKMFRIINGKLYMDWPWGRNRFYRPYASMSNLLLYLTNTIRDLPDCVFLIGIERSISPWNFPFPIFTNSPSFMSSDIPFPWWAPLSKEIRTYRHVLDTNKDFSFTNYSKYFDYQPHLDWHLRKNKAAFYGGLTSMRQLFMDIAITRPDLFDAGWTGDYGISHGNPWNPLSKERTPLKDIVNDVHSDIHNNASIGYLQHLYSKRIQSGIDYHPGTYKYLVVLSGLDGLASADRLGSFIAHSGAVVLLQDSPFKYHFSDRLKPWIHYVPISYSTADVIDKIEWLKNHDHFAERIANNAKIFGASYLRLEDYFCYMATAIETIANIQNGSDILKPFDPELFVSKEENGW